MIKNKFFIAISFLSIIGNLSVNSQVVYTDVNPDVVVYGYYLTQAGTYSFDLNNDGINDFELMHMDFDVPAAEADIYSSNNSNSEILGENDIYYSYITYALEENYLIGSTQTTWLSPDGNNWLGKLYSNGEAPWQWGSSTDKYLGLRIKINGEWHYGWARLNIPVNGANITLKDFAYESTAEQPILTGDIGSTNITNQYQPDYLAFSNGKTLRIFLKNNKLFGGNAKIFNVLGKEIKSFRINSVKMEVQLNDLSQGIFILKIKKNNYCFLQKFYLSK